MLLLLLLLVVLLMVVVLLLLLLLLLLGSWRRRRSARSVRESRIRGDAVPVRHPDRKLGGFADPVVERWTPIAAFGTTRPVASSPARTRSGRDVIGGDVSRSQG